MQTSRPTNSESEQEDVWANIQPPWTTGSVQIILHYFIWIALLRALFPPWPTCQKLRVHFILKANDLFLMSTCSYCICIKALFRLLHCPLWRRAVKTFIKHVGSQYLTWVKSPLLKCHPPTIPKRLTTTWKVTSDWLLTPYHAPQQMRDAYLSSQNSRSDNVYPHTFLG